MKAHLKFKESATSAERAELLRDLESRNSISVSRLFPDASDDELASIFLLEQKGSSKKLLKDLNKRSIVEYAEPEASRSLAGRGVR